MSKNNDLYLFIGNKIKELRMTRGLKQEDLAGTLKVKTNTISRWETATYKPSADDLQKLSDFFKVSISTFFPQKFESDDRLAALASATGDLLDEDLEELLRYAEFRKARRVLELSKK